MDWLLGRKSIVPGSNRSKNPTSPDEGQKAAYLNDKYLNGALLHKSTKEDLQETVPVPPGVDQNEWLATHTLSFFNHINLMYSSLSEFCTTSTCSTVSNGAPMNFTWVDDKGKKTRLTAPQYIELVIVQVEKYITDETIFATKYDNTFPANFHSMVKKIFRLLFHVLVHIYQSHYEHCAELQQLIILNTLFVHFMLFQSEHSLLEAKEVVPLEDLVKSLCL